MVQFGQNATIRENPFAADKTMEKLPAVDNPTYEMKMDLDMVEVKENIYSTIHENPATLDSAADQSDL